MIQRWRPLKVVESKTLKKKTRIKVKQVIIYILVPNNIFIESEANEKKSGPEGEGDQGSENPQEAEETEVEKLQKALDEKNTEFDELKTKLAELKSSTKNKLEFSEKLDDLKNAYNDRIDELQTKMKYVAGKIPMIIKEAKYNKKNFEELNALKKEKMKKIDTLRNKRETNIINKKKLETKLLEFDSHQEMLNDKIVNHENMLKKLAKKENNRKDDIPESIAGVGKDYKRNARHQIVILEARVEELEKQLFQIQEKKKGNPIFPCFLNQYLIAKEVKPDSDEDLDIEDDTPTGGQRLSSLPDIRIGAKTKKGAKNKTSIMLKDTLRDVKEKDAEIERLKDEIRKSQMKIKHKDKEIAKLRIRVKKYASDNHTAYA